MLHTNANAAWWTHSSPFSPHGESARRRVGSAWEPPLIEKGGTFILLVSDKSAILRKHGDDRFERAICPPLLHLLVAISRRHANLKT